MTCELTMIGRWTLIYYEQFQEKISYQLCRNLLLLLWSLLAFFSCSTGSSTSPFRGTRLDWMSEFSKPTTSFSTMGPIQSSISLWPLQTSATFEKVKNEILKKKSRQNEIRYFPLTNITYQRSKNTQRFNVCIEIDNFWGCFVSGSYMDEWKNRKNCCGKVIVCL